ncbi:MAG: protoporphyrinogen oxidase [Anaerolineae bacterium]|jgi:protoporphyrinogen/coproporphyrinogen III oxidase|nr:protoporphyrinogen oxidase [Anaerolineae bacterium]
MPELIIVGGGITGLSAAWEAQQNGISYALLEKTSRWGGKVHTEIVNFPEGKAIIDGGPESFITRKPEAWDLVGELGIQDSVINPGAETRHMYILDGGMPVEVPLAPVKFASSRLMSGGGKLRMMLEPFQPPKADDADESLADFVTRRLGREALDKFIGPILGGIYNTDPDTQSILVSSPIMREMEAEYGGLVKAMIGRMRKARKNKLASDDKKPRFGAFANGLQELTDELARQLTGDLRLDTNITRIEKDESNYQIFLENGEKLSAKKLIFATPANITAKLLTDIAEESAKKLATIKHENIGTVTLIYREEEIQSDFPIHGLMIPRREKRAIDAVTFTSLKMPTRVPKGYGVIRVFFGGSKPNVAEVSDSDLLKTVRDELKSTIGITVEPIQIVPFRWLKSFPQANVGHLDFVDEIEKTLPEGIYLAGSSYRGIGVPDCIQQGRQAVKKSI